MLIKLTLLCCCFPYSAEGAPCTEDRTCESMTNARCRQGKCSCQDNYVLDNGNSSSCISSEWRTVRVPVRYDARDRRLRNELDLAGPTKEGDRCQREDDCQDALGRAMCINEFCRCVSEYHFVNQTGKCVQTRCKSCVAVVLPTDFF